MRDRISRARFFKIVSALDLKVNKMDFRSLLPSMTLGASIVAFAAFAGSAHAQSALSNCNAATGLGQNGLPCVELTPLDPSRISDVAPDADGSEQYQRLDTNTLGQTYACRQLDGTGGGAGRGQLLIEDCGAPISAAELGPLKPFYGTAGAPPPPPPPQPVFVPPPQPAPVIAVAPPPPPPVLIPPAPIAPAPVAIASSGLGNAGLLAAGLGAAALIGIAVVAIGDDDDSTNATTGTQ